MWVIGALSFFLNLNLCGNQIQAEAFSYSSMAISIIFEKLGWNICIVFSEKAKK